MIHTVKFERNDALNKWRGYCTCGWEMTGERLEVQGRAATHDLDFPKWASPGESGGLATALGLDKS